MRRARIAAICLAAGLVSGGLAASNALGAAEIGRCVAQAGTGKFKDANCTEKAGTKIEEKQFEFKKGGEALGYTAAGGEGVIETVSGSKLVCKARNETGKYDDDSGTIKEVEEVVMTFKGCELPIFSASCQNPGAPAGEITTLPLKGPLGYISGEKTTKPVVGLELTPETAKGVFEEYECAKGAIKFIVKGEEGAVEGKTGGNCVIAPFSEVNVMSASFQQTYSGEKGVQNPQHFQLATSKFCNLIVNSNGGAFERMTWAITSTITNEEALEIKA
jgi:hypothetical protein